MKYLGSKDRYAKYLLHYMLFDREPGQPYVELFAGGMNVIDKVKGQRIANDINPYLIEMFKMLCTGWQPPKVVTREEYEHIKNHKIIYPYYLVGYVGFCCSYSGKFFGGYANESETKLQTIRKYQDEARRNLLKQVHKLQGVEFVNLSYEAVTLPPRSIIYCDPPYEGTTEYFNGKFDSPKLFDFLRLKKAEGHTIFLTEYKAPADFKLVVKLNAISSLSANGTGGGAKKSIEKLFTL